MSDERAKRMRAALLVVVASSWSSATAGSLAADVVADRVLVEKAERRLTLLKAGQVLKTYKVALGRSPEGPKRQQGDGRTPEGTYAIAGRKADSTFHLALRISYPSASDTTRARAEGAEPGGDIMIHGIKNGFGWIGSLHTTYDWTEGCIAVTDEEIEEIWRAVPDGTPVEIRP